MAGPYITTPNMGLSLPVPSSAPGPDWASALNAALAFVDQHTHNTGSGVPITPSGLNINANLPVNLNGVVDTGFLNFGLASTPATDTSIYSPDGINIWFLDGNGNNFAITAGGGVNASVGTLTGGTAQAAFVSNVLVVNSVQSTGVPGNIQAQSVLFGNASAGTDFVTLSAPSSTSTYGLVLPTIPSSTSLLQIDTSGNITAPFPSPSIPSATQYLAINSSGAFITTSVVVAPNYAISSSTGVYGTITGSFVTINNQSVSIITTGRPVEVKLQPDGTLFPSLFTLSSDGGDGCSIGVQLQRDGSTIAYWELGWNAEAAGNWFSLLPVSSINFLDIGASAGSHTYTFQWKGTTGTPVISYAVTVAKET